MRLGKGKLKPGRFGGRHLNGKGYVRISGGPNRNKYEHRLVMAEMVREWCYYPVEEGKDLPEGFHVEHVDHNRTHNCGGNLLLLDVRIHDYISWCSWLDRPTRGEVAGQEEPVRGLDDWDPKGSAEARWLRGEDLAVEVPF